jgi:hypothetical protein
MTVRSKERDKDYQSKSYLEDPRFYASGLGKCYRQQSYWMRGVEPDHPDLDPITRLTFETGNMWESWMGDWYLDWMLQNDERVDRIETQVVFRFTTRQGVVISGKADFVIWWNCHPETGQPEVEIGDFKTDSDYGFNLRRTGKDTFQTAHMLQVMIGAIALKTREENPIDVTRWRVVYIAKGLPFRKHIFAWDDKGNDPMDFAAVEFAESATDPKWLDYLRIELKALAALEEMVTNGEEVARQIPFANMAYAIDAFDPETGKGVFTHEDGTRRQWWGCSGGSRTLTSYCNYRLRCEAELNGETFVPFGQREPEPEPDELADWQASVAAQADDGEWDESMVAAEEAERQRRIREMKDELAELRAEDDADVERGQQLMAEAAALDITPEDLATQMAMERDEAERPNIPAPPPVRLEDCTSITQVSAWTLHDARERLELEGVEGALSALGARWDCLKRGQGLGDMVKVDRGGEVVEVERFELTAKALHWLERSPDQHPARALTPDELARRDAIKTAAMATIQAERDEMRAQALAEACLWCGEPSPDSDYCTPEHAVAAMADKAGYDICMGERSNGDECGRPIPRGQITCHSAECDDLDHGREGDDR